MNDKKIQYDPETGGFIQIEGVSDQVKNSLTKDVKSNWDNGISFSPLTTPPSGQKASQTIYSTGYVKYGGFKNSSVKIDKWQLEEIVKEYTPHESTLVTYIHDILIKILKGDVDREDYWKEDRETLIEYFSQVLYSIISPEAEEKVKEALVDKALMKIGNLADILRDLEITREELREKDSKIISLGEQLTQMNNRFAELLNDFRALEEEVRRNEERRTTPERDYDGSWGYPYC